MAAPHGMSAIGTSSGSQQEAVESRDRKLLFFSGVVGRQKGKYKGICMGTDGRLYCAPYHASRVLVIDPAAQALSVMDGVGHAPDKYSGICAGPDGKLYCAPC